MLFHKKNKKYGNGKRGFTLTELIVTVSIVTLLTTVAVANFRQVDNSLVLQNVAHQVALVARKAQISGISVQGIESGGVALFPSYGINFDMSKNTSFILFSDTTATNKLFDGVCPKVLPTDECVGPYTLANGYTIKELCGNLKTGGSFATCALSRLDISFTRPNPDALMIGNISTPPTGFSDGEIVIQSKTGKTKTIVIWKTGQISIQ
jgi:prepilin-type N-terminal cleavage/methylation domain-containing protein